MIDVVCTAIIQNSRFMIAQKPMGRKNGGLWEFPGGKVEKGESHQAAISRELSEELGFDCDPHDLFSLGRIQSENLSLNFYALHLFQSYVPMEHRAVAWVPFSNLVKYPLCEADGKAIQQFKSGFLEALTSAPHD